MQSDNPLTVGASSVVPGFKLLFQPGTDQHLDVDFRLSGLRVNAAADGVIDGITGKKKKGKINDHTKQKW